MDKYCPGFGSWQGSRRFSSSACGRNAIAIEVVVPKSGGMNTTRVNVVRWLKREGEFVKLREPLVELETEKVSYELDSPAEGVLLRIVSPQAAEVPVEGCCAISAPVKQSPHHREWSLRSCS